MAIHPDQTPPSDEAPWLTHRDRVRVATTVDLILAGHQIAEVDMTLELEGDGDGWRLIGATVTDADDRPLAVMHHMMHPGDPPLELALAMAAIDRAAEDSLQARAWDEWESQQ